MTWLDKQIATIFIWYRRRRLMKAIPGYRTTLVLEAEGKRRHANTSHIREQRKRIILNALAGRGTR